MPALKYIPDKNQRNITFCKRKRGLMKKSIELSTMCDQMVILYIYDNVRQKLSKFQSHDEFDAATALHFEDMKFRNNLHYESFKPSDYDFFKETQGSIADQAIQQTAGKQPEKVGNLLKRV